MINEAALLGLDGEGIAEKIAELQRQQERLNRFDGLMQTEGGKFLKQELHAQVSHIRKLYKTVRADLPTCAVALAGLQGEERRLSELLRDLSEYKIRKNELDNELKLLEGVLRNGDKEPTQGHSIAPRGIQHGRADD